ncbi:dihydroorotate dehydrogenase [Clostridia bacterium]|nr:dihydroorotate dehydrogenase [Clostridia bacterium]
MDVSRLGGICSKGLTLNPKEGNYGTRMWETPSGMLNSVGLQNPGVKQFIRHELEIMRGFDTVAIVNMGGGTIDEYIEGAALLDGAGIEMLELNISCPNVKQGGAAFGIKASVAREVVSQVRKVFRGPLMVKLSPSAEDIVEMALACEEAGADALSLINTLKAMAIDVYKRKPVFRNMVAGLSGPAVRPVALRMVWETARAVSIPVVGLGGILCGRDAIEFIMAGAAAVQVGTANFTKPGIMLDIIAEIGDFMREQGIASLDEIRGCV